MKNMDGMEWMALYLRGGRRREGKTNGREWWGVQVIYTSQEIADRGRLLLRMETKMQGDVEIVEGEREGWRLRMSYWRLG